MLVGNMNLSETLMEILWRGTWEEHTGCKKCASDTAGSGFQHINTDECFDTE